MERHLSEVGDSERVEHLQPSRFCIAGGMPAAHECEGHVVNHFWEEELVLGNVEQEPDLASDRGQRPARESDALFSRRFVSHASCPDIIPCAER